MNKMKKYRAVDYFAYACSALVYILPQYLLSSFLSPYYTDVALVSAGAVGAVVLVMRFTDGISDLIMGRVIDRTNSRLGKARPWLLVGTIGLAVFLICTFHVPAAMGQGAKIAWLAVTYFMVMTVFGTVQGVASNTMMIYMTNDANERNRFGASNMAGVYVGGIVATTMTAVLLGRLGYNQSGYDKTMLLYTFFVLVFGVFSFGRLRETKGIGEQEKKQENVSIGTVLRSMLKNKYYVYTVIVGLLCNLANGIATGMGVYYCRDIFGNADLYAVVTLALLLPTLAGLPFAVAIAKKAGHHKTLVYGRIGSLAGVVLEAAGILSGTLTVYFIGIVFRGICNAAFAACFTARVANTCDYGEYKFRTNASGIMMSATSFCNKIGLGLGSALTGLILEMAKYDGAKAAAGIAQSAYTITVERYAVAILPIAIYVVVLVCMYLGNVDPHMDEVRKGLEQRQNH